MISVAGSEMMSKEARYVVKEPTLDYRLRLSKNNVSKSSSGSDIFLKKRTTIELETGRKIV